MSFDLDRREVVDRDELAARYNSSIQGNVEPLRTNAHRLFATDDEAREMGRAAMSSWTRTALALVLIEAA